MDASKRFTNVMVENTSLNRSLLVKEKLIEELHRHVAQKEADWKALKIRLDHAEKENILLKNDFQILEKEVEVKNVELEYYRRTIDSSRRQHFENLQKISKLESECQRFQTLSKKRQPGPASLTKTGWDKSQVRKKSYQALPQECLSSCLENLRAMEEENNALRGMLEKKTAELQSSRTMYSRTASKLSQVDAQLTALSGNLKQAEVDVDSRSDGSSSVSWANALITELNHFKDEKLRNQTDAKPEREADMSLMDDFVEVEKLSLLAFQDPKQDPSTCMEIQPVNDVHNPGEEINEGPYDWLQDVMKAISKQRRISKRSSHDLIKDVRIAMGCYDQPPMESNDRDFDPNAIVKMNDLIKDLKDTVNGSTEKEGDDSVGVFKWRSSELDATLERLAVCSSALLEKKICFSSFIDDLNIALQWMMSSINTNSMKENTYVGELPLVKINDIESKEKIEKTQKLIDEEQSLKLAVAKAKLNEILQKVASLEIELEHKSQCCDELEATCLELQLELEGGDRRMSAEKIYAGGEEKLTESQTKALVPLTDQGPIRMIIETKHRSSTKRFSLREQIEAEDSEKALVVRKRQDGGGGSFSKRDIYVHSRSPNPCLNSRSGRGDLLVGTLVVPGRKQGFGLWKKLLMKKKEASRKRSAR